MGTKLIFVALGLILLMEKASACRKNSQCSSGWCEGGHAWPGSSGRCISKRHDGQHCYNGDANSCHSRQCTCGLCGRKQNGNAACATNDNCHSNWCEKRSWSFGCTGRCIAKRADGQLCHNNDGNSCAAGQCTCGRCGRKQGAGATCATNDNCHSNWCERPNGRLGCSGRCQNKRYDGQACHNGDGNSCRSGQCTCGRCGTRQGTGATCATNANCHSNWCQRPNGRLGCSGTCQAKRRDGVACHNGDGNSCLTGQCTCGRCGRKQGTGATCATNDNCHSNWCQRPNGRLGCSGTCQNKRNDGQACHNGDGYSCLSGQCTCGTCGRHLPNNKKCATNDNCQSRWCHPAVTIGCGGSCRRKAYDYEGCVDSNHCVNGRCEGVSRSNKYCAPKKGFRPGFQCNEDTDCDVTQSLWCKGGSAFTTGSCTRCPSECKDGCNALFDQGLSCGRKNTWDHVGDIIMCVAGVEDLNGCAKEFAGVIKDCIDGVCDVVIGGPGKECLKMGKDIEYTKSYGSGAPTLTVSGKMKAEGGVQLGLGLTVPSRLDMSMKLHGTIALHAKAELSFNSVRTREIKHRIELARPKVLFRKVIQAGPMPIMIILRIQPVAYAELTTQVSASGSISFSYDNPKALTIRDVGINVKGFKPSVITPQLSLDLNKDIVPDISIKGEVSVMGFLRIGPEIVVEVNGMPFTFYPSVYVKLGTSLQYSNNNGKHCVYGEIVGGIGIDAGIKGPISGFSPGAAASSACMLALQGICKAIDMNIKAKTAACIAKQITKKDPCKKEGPEECSKLGKEISKVEPTNPFKGLDELSKEIMKPREIVKSVSLGDCAGVSGSYAPGGGSSSCKITLYALSSYRGASNVYTTNVASVRSNNAMSSYKISPGCCVTFYDQHYYRGASIKWCNGKATVGSWDNRVSSLKLSSGIQTVGIQRTINALTTKSPPLIIMCHRTGFPFSYGVGKMYKGGVTDSKFKSSEIVTWQNTAGGVGGCQWLGWSDRMFANQNLRISFWIKFVGSVPPPVHNFGMKVYGAMYNSWVRKCKANTWCHVVLVKRCGASGDGYHVILIFDSINRRQTVRIAQLQIQILSRSGKDETMEVEDVRTELNDEEIIKNEKKETKDEKIEEKDNDDQDDQDVQDDQVTHDMTFEDYYGATLYDNERIVTSKGLNDANPEQLKDTQAAEPEKETQGHAPEHDTKALDEAAELIAEDLSEAAELIAEDLSEAAELDAKDLSDAAEPATKALDEAAKPATKALDDGTEPIPKVLDQPADPITKVLDEAVEPATKVMDKAAEPATKVLDEAAEPATEVLDEAAEPATKVLDEAAEPATKVSDEAADPDTKFLDEAPESTEKVLDEAAEPMTKVLDEAAEAIKETLNEATEPEKAITSDIDVGKNIPELEDQELSELADEKST